MDDLHLYEVIIRGMNNAKRRFLVASWLGPNKAIAMAVLANDAASRPVRLFDVAVTDLGIAPDALPSDALVDRLEF